MNPLYNINDKFKYDFGNGFYEIFTVLNISPNVNFNGQYVYFCERKSLIYSSITYEAIQEDILRNFIRYGQ